MAEDMIETGNVTLTAEGGRDVAAYLAQPKAGSGAGLIILHDMFGPNPVFRALADAYAAKGYSALLPNLFWNCEPSGLLAYEGSHEAAWRRVASFDFDAATRRIDLSADWLRGAAQGADKIAVLGFCFSGRLAFLAAARARIDAAISFYGVGLSHHLDEIGKIDCPVQLHYGMEDPHVPRAEIEAVAAASAGRRNIAVHLYPGAGHSFFNAIRPSYDAAAAALAGQRVEELLVSLSRAAPAGAPPGGGNARSTRR